MQWHIQFRNTKYYIFGFDAYGNVQDSMYHYTNYSEAIKKCNQLNSEGA